MPHHYAEFHNKTELYTSEIAYAKQHRMIKEAQRAGLKLQPVVSIRPLVMALAQVLTRFSSLLAAWSCRLSSRYSALPAVEPSQNSRS